VRRYISEQQICEVVTISEVFSVGSNLSRISPEKLEATELIVSALRGSPPGNAVTITRLQILAVFGAPIASRACATKEADSALLLRKYCEKPPLLTSDSTAQIAEKIFCGTDCRAKSSFPNFVFSDSDKPMRISFLFKVAYLKILAMTDAPDQT
jgi:hypothetical protein